MPKVRVSRPLIEALCAKAIWAARDYHSVHDPELWAVVCSDEFRALLTPRLSKLLNECRKDIELELRISQLPEDAQRALLRLRSAARVCSAGYGSRLKPSA